MRPFQVLLSTLPGQGQGPRCLCPVLFMPKAEISKSESKLYDKGSSRGSVRTFWLLPRSFCIYRLWEDRLGSLVIPFLDLLHSAVLRTAPFAHRSVCTRLPLHTALFVHPLPLHTVPFVPHLGPWVLHPGLCGRASFSVPVSKHSLSHSLDVEKG